VSLASIILPDFSLDRLKRMGKLILDNFIKFVQKAIAAKGIACGIEQRGNRNPEAGRQFFQDRAGK
jgi:hypothetical protein